MMQNLNRKNSFEDYGAEPSSLVWEKIEKRLPPPQGKKRGWLIWSIAAVLTGGVLLSAYWFDIEIKLKKEETAEKSAAPSKNETTASTKKTGSEKNQPPVTKTGENIVSAKKEKTGSEKITTVQTEKNTIKSSIKKKNETRLSEEETVTAKENISDENKAGLPEEAVETLTEPAVTSNEFIKNILPKNISTIPVPGDSLQPLHASWKDFLPVKKKYSASRWHFSVAGGENYSYRALNFSSAGNNPPSEGEKNYLSGNERGIQTPVFETGIGYSISTHFNLSFGINYFVAGQERTQSEIIFSSGVAGTPNTQYFVNTSAGVVTANGGQVDNAFFNNNDTSLFTGIITITGNSPPEDSSTTQYFNLRQEFSFIGFPLLIQYQTAEHRFTPFIGLGISAGYILSERVIMNDKELDYNYRQSVNEIIFFAEAQAGVKYRISHKLYLKLQPSLRYGLNSLNGDDSIEWIPYSAGVSGGIHLRF